jgi:hypothetical protein
MVHFYTLLTFFSAWMIEPISEGNFLRKVYFESTENKQANKETGSKIMF